METLTLTLHKIKDTKNKVVYGTKDGDVIQSVYIDKAALATFHRPRSRWSYHRSKPRSLAGKPLAGFRATPDRRIIPYSPFGSNK